MIAKEVAYSSIQELVARFEEQIDLYKQAECNETFIRRDFIDPFFKALGWDVENSLGYAETYREVFHEDKAKAGKATKAPDYLFRLQGGNRLFFVETKKPSLTLKDGISVAYQIRRYGWSAKAPISIITDFEEFAVYDCTKKPHPADKPGVARIKYFNFTDYLTEFEYLWNIFSKEKVLKGSFHTYIQGDTFKKGTATVDKEFLASLDKWRTYLATTINQRNKGLSEDEINYAVQLTIDRLIFLRIAEDRGIEQYGLLKKSVNQIGDPYQTLFYHIKRVGEKYSSGLFDFTKDVISEKLQIDSMVIKTIVNEMYYPDSPFEFSIIPIEILGSAYEQFLGKVIRVTPAHHAKIEDKPEVRKAGGVYYTPQYVVDYIVKNTVGKLIDGKSPKQIERIKIADPACGSGSFLIGAYQYLLDYHTNYYSEKGAKTGKRDSPITPEKNLTLTEKKRILLNNIYGVDIDVNAVEVTKLSLLLKCMQGETGSTFAQQQQLCQERILPTLDQNIKSGNSLIDVDFYDGKLDFGEEKTMKPFSWEKAFPDVFNRSVEIDNSLIFKNQYDKVKDFNKETKKFIDPLIKEPEADDRKQNSGFDIIIGNPPYVKASDESQIAYFDKKYRHQDYQHDLYLLFLEQYSHLLITGGLLGIIIPNTWLQSIRYRNIRKYLVSQYFWERILQFNSHVFKAIVDTHVLVFEKNSFLKNKSMCIDLYEDGLVKEYQIIDQNTLPFDGEIINIVATTKEKELFEKIKSKSVSLKDACKVYNGVKPFEKGKGNPPQTEQVMKEKPFVVEKTYKPDGNDWYPLLRGSLINRYRSLWNRDSWIKYGEWLAAPRKIEIFQAEEKIVVRQTGDSIIATIIGKDIIARDNLHIIISERININFVLGIINSKLINFYYNHINSEKGKVLAQVKKSHVEQLPIPKIHNENKALEDEIIVYVNQLLKLNEELRFVNHETKNQSLTDKISYCAGRINTIVYKLFDLSEEEIKIVEGSNG